MNPTKVKTIALAPVDLHEGQLLVPGRSALVDGDEPHIAAQIDVGRLLVLPADADVDFESLPANYAAELADEQEGYAHRLKTELADEATTRGLSGADTALKAQLVDALVYHDQLVADGADITETDVAALAELARTPTTEEPKS